MIVAVKQNAKEEQLQDLIKWIESLGVNIHLSRGSHTTIIGLVGDTSKISIDTIRSNKIVDSVQRIQEPYKSASRKFHPDDTVIDINGHKIGGGHFQVISGPCSVESEEQICETALRVKAAGANLLRGGAFKPRTSPYAFQGLRADGIELLLKAKELTGMPIVTEIMDASHIHLFENVDVIQVGARNMQNFELLKMLSKLDKPILLKRGLANTITELLMSAEYILAGGNQNVILCERGIRTFETATRNTLDIGAVPLIHKLSHLPVVIDPSHATGIPWMVEPLSVASVAAGVDGLIIEVHNNPSEALCDGAQSLTPDQFDKTMQSINNIAKFTGKRI